MSEENRVLVRRITGLEMAVKRLQMAMGGIVSATELARLTVIRCDRCDCDVDKAVACEYEDCPCGLPHEPESHDGSAAQD